MNTVGYIRLRLSGNDHLASEKQSGLKLLNCLPKR